MALVCKQYREDLADEAPDEGIQGHLLLKKGPQHVLVAIVTAQLVQNGKRIFCL